MNFNNMLANAKDLCFFPDGPLTPENMEYVRGIAELLADCSGNFYGDMDHEDVKDALLWELSTGRMGARPVITAEHVLRNATYHTRNCAPCLMYRGRHRLWFLMFGDTEDRTGRRYTALSHPTPSPDTRTGVIDRGMFRSVWESAQAVAEAENVDDGSHTE